jgi:hypothetical protein
MGKMLTRGNRLSSRQGMLDATNAAQRRTGRPIGRHKWNKNNAERKGEKNRREEVIMSTRAEKKAREDWKCQTTRSEMGKRMPKMGRAE